MKKNPKHKKSHTGYGKLGTFQPSGALILNDSTEGLPNLIPRIPAPAPVTKTSSRKKKS